MNTTYLFLGDSITDAHHLWMPETGGLGNGYVSMLNDLLRAGQDPAPGQNQNPENSVTVWNRGIDGLTVSALLRQLTRSPIKGYPDVICLLIGINDVGVAQNTCLSLEQLEFAEHYAQVLELLQATGARLLLAGPFLFPHPQEYLLWMPNVQKAEKIEADAAKKAGIPFLPLHDYLNGLVQNSDYSSITLDGIHLTGLGHRMLAEYLFPHLQIGASPF